MEWKTLLATTRLSDKDSNHRNEFDDDYKRIVTSPAFRRLQDKTQVFPLERLDFIHTRLTHSLEVAMIARTLVSEIVRLLQQDSLTETDSSKQEMIEHQSDIARIVECASLLHDIGNPPYGHFGEDIIRQWFKKNLPRILAEHSDVADEFLASPYVHDFYHFEGNAQSLRIISKLHERLVKNGVKKVSFCSREGQLLKVLFDMYQEIFFKNDIIESKYLYVSRRSTLYPSFSKDLDTENFEIIFRQCKRISLENFLANLDISDDDINKIAYQMEVDSNIELESESKLLKKLKNNQLFAKLYLEKKKLSEVFSEYISEFLDNDILNLVDVGWKGTIQDNIQKSLPKLNIRGYYLGLIFNDYSFVQKENKTALLFTDYPNKSLGFDILYRNFGFYEEIFVADHGPVIGYEKKGDGIIPIFDMDKKHTNIYRFVKEYQEKMIVGYSELLESYKKTCYLPNEKYILTLEKSLKKECLFIPKIIDLESKLKANTEENFGNIKENNEIKQVNFKRVLKTRKDFLWVDYYYKLVPFKILANALCRLIYRIKWFQYIYGRK